MKRLIGKLSISMSLIFLALVVVGMVGLVVEPTILSHWIRFDVLQFTLERQDAQYVVKLDPELSANILLLLSLIVFCTLVIACCAFMQFGLFLLSSASNERRSSVPERSKRAQPGGDGYAAPDFGQRLGENLTIR